VRQRTCPLSAPNCGRARDVLVDRPDGFGVTENNGSARIDDYASISKNTVSTDHHVVERGLPEALYDRVNVEPLIRGTSSSCAHLLFDRDISDRTCVMFAIHSSDEELRIVRLRQVEPEDRFGNPTLGNKRLENRRSLKAREGLVSKTQKAIRDDIESRHVRGRAKCLLNSLVIENRQSSVSRASDIPTDCVPSKGDSVCVLFNAGPSAASVCKVDRFPDMLRGRTLRGIVQLVSLAGRATRNSGYEKVAASSVNVDCVSWD